MWGHDYKKLIAWQKAMDLTEEVYSVIKLLPQSEQFALCDQMRRSVVSVPSNIAEGYGRSTPKDIAHFLSIARASVYELETQLLICVRLKYVQEDYIENSLKLVEEASKLINALIYKVKNSQ